MSEPMAASDQDATLSLPLLTPLAGDVVNLSLQVSVAGTVRVSLLSISSRIASFISTRSSPPPSLLTPEPPLPSALAHLPPQATRIRVLGHTRAEAKDGTEYVAYMVEYHRQQPSTSSFASSPASPTSAGKPLVTSKRFSDFYSLHRHLSLSFLCLPPFPPRTLLRSLSDAALIRDRELALTLYLQLIAQREDIRKTGELERFLLQLHEGEGMGGGATTSPDELKQRERSDTERERDVDARMKVEESAAAVRRGEERKAEETGSQHFDLLIDQFSVLHTRHIDIDAVKEHSSKEQEMRQTSFASKDSKSTLAAEAASTPASAPAPPASSSLSFYTRSATFTLCRALLPSPLLLFVVAGDSSKLGHLDAFITGLWTGFLDSRKSAEKLVRERSKPDTYDEVQQLAQEQAEADGDREAEQPLGAVYAFHRATTADQWQPTLSLFFERELVDAVWDAKRGWVYLLTDDGLCHVYSPLAADWTKVRKVWTLRVHTARIASARFSTQLDALLSMSVDGHFAAFDLASLSLSSAFTEPARMEDSVEAIKGALGWKERGSGLAYDSVHDRVMIGGSDGAIAVWAPGKVGVRDARLLGLMKGHAGLVRDIAFDEASGVLVSGRSGWGAVAVGGKEGGRGGRE